MSTTPPFSFRFPFESQIAELSPGVQQVHRTTWNAITDIQQAIPLLKSQIDAKANTAAVTPATNDYISNNSETVISGGGTAANVIGYVNNQSGVTSYVTLPSDYGIYIILDDTSAITVTLSVAPLIQLPWFATFINVGTGTATLTPASGLIDGTATLPLPGSSSVAVTFDGTNFWAEPVIGAGGGFSNPMTTAGDLIVGGTGGAPTRLGIGADGDVLTVVAGAESWEPASGGSGVTSLNTETGALTLTSAGGTVAITTPTSTTINLESAGASGSILTTTASIAVASGGGQTSQFVALAGTAAATAFVTQLQPPGIPFTLGGSPGYMDYIPDMYAVYATGGCTLNVSTTPPSGGTFTAGNYPVNIKAIL